MAGTNQHNGPTSSGLDQMPSNVRPQYNEPFFAVLQPGGHRGLLPAVGHDAPVDPGRAAASVDLRHPPHADQRAAAGPEQHR